MANFLDDLSVYNAKAALVISQAAADGNTEKANMMSSLKTTANDTTLSETVRLNALTALINLGSLLDIPLPPYFPLTTTYANTQTYVGIHDDLTGLQGGSPGEYYHLTLAEKIQALSAATAGDITFANLGGAYTDNASLVTGFAGKQNALSGTGFVKISGTTISYDNSTYLSSISGIAAGGELSGTYPNPALSNAAVISKVLTGFTGTSLPIQITSSDSILSAMQKLNDNIASLIVSPTGVASVALTTNSSGVFTTTTTPQTGAANLDVSLNSQTANKFLASPNGSSGVPTFRAFVADDLPNSGASAGAYGSASLIPQITVDAKGRITAITTVAAAAGGQVNSVNLSIPGGIFTTPTNTGTASDPILTFVLATQTANYVWAGPVSGAAAAPYFRALVADDIPSLPTSKITGLTNILSGYLTDSLSDGSIWIGNTSNAAVQRVMSGDVTISNTGVTTIGAAKVQYSMIQDVTTQTLLGRYDAVDGEVQQITLSGDFLLNSGTGVLSLSSPVSPVVTTKGDLLGHNTTSQARLPSSGIDGDLLIVDGAESLGLKWVTAQGDVEVDTIALDGTLNITGGAVTLGKMANLAANRIIGNNTGSSATPLPLTGTDVTAMLDQFSTTAKGLVPAASLPGDTSKFLMGDGSWQPITGTGTVTSVSVVTAKGFAGTVADDTTAAKITIKLDNLTGVLKGSGDTIAVATAGTDVVTPGQITQIAGAGSGLTMASGNLLGRVTSSAGPIEAITVNSSLSLSLPSGVPTLGLNLGNGNVFTVQQQMPSLRLNGSTSGFVSFTPPATAGAQAYTLPTAFPGTGTTGYLTSTDAGVLAWASATGTTTNAVTFNNSGSGDASGTTFNGSAARTISYNTLGAQALNANLTGLSGLTYASGTPFVKMTGAGTFALDTNTYIAGTTTQYSVLVGGAGNSIVSITPVVSNRLLISNGTTSNPGWTQATYLDTIVSGGILYGSGTDSVGQIATPTTADTFLKWDGSTFTWAAGGGGGGGTTTNSLTINNSGTGSASGVTFNGSASVTISSNTVLPSFTGNAGYVLAVNGTEDNVQWSPVGNVTGAGNAGRVAYWDSGSNITGSADFYWDNSTKFLGIGTTTPECGLHVTTTGSQNIKGIMNMHFDNTASAQAKYIGARARGNNPNNPSALQTDDAITSLSGRGYKATTWSNTVGGYYVYAAENWTDAATGTYLTFRGVVSGGTTVSEWARLTSSSTLVELALGQSSTKSGGLLLYSSGGAFTTRLQASPSASSSETYILPATDGTSGQLLSTDGNGVMSWITGIGSGDVVGPNGGVSDGDFVVFDMTTGKLIKEPLNASLTAAGRATFNSGVDVGVSSSTTGTLVFRNSSNAFTTTLQASTGAAANLIYTWPTSAPAAGNILSSDANGNLTWTAAGAGNMVLATAGQIVTGSKIYADATLLLRNPATSFSTTLSAGASTAARTITFPDLTGTVALLDNAQTFTGAKTFTTGAFTVSSAATFSASAASAATVTINNGANASLTNPQLLIGGGTSGTTIQYIGFGPANMQGNRDIPNTTSRSIGTKIVLFGTVGSGNADHAIGVASVSTIGITWISAPTATSHKTSIYGGASELAYFRNNGIYAEMPGSASQGQITIGTNTASTYAYLDFGGGTNVRGVPAAARSVGTRINLFASSTGTDDYSIGVAANETWIKTNNNTGATISFYGAITKIVDIGTTIGSAPIINLNASTGEYRVNGTKVVGQRETGYAAFTGTTNKGTAYATGTVTLIQLAERVAAIQASLTTHGLIS